MVRTKKHAKSAQPGLQELLQRAQQGDASVLPDLGRLVEDNPGLWQSVGNLAGHARGMWLNLIAGKDLLARECIRRMVAEMKKSLSGPATSQLEVLLVDRVIATWLQVQFCEMQATAAKDGRHNRDRLDMDYHERAERRHLAAIRQLAMVRRLLPARSQHSDAVANGAQAVNGPIQRAASMPSKDKNSRAPAKDHVRTKSKGRRRAPGIKVYRPKKAS